jgi:hypothetical protein
MLNPWMAFSFQAVRFGWEVQNEALRLLGLAGGGTNRHAEAKPEVAENDSRYEIPTSAASVSVNGAQTAAASPVITPVRGRRGAAKIMKVHNKKSVRTKKRRLSK